MVTGQSKKGYFEAKMVTTSINLNVTPNENSSDLYHLNVKKKKKKKEIFKNILFKLPYNPNTGIQTANS